MEKNKKGWELGVRSVTLTDLGKRLLKGSADATSKLVSANILRLIPYV